MKVSIIIPYNNDRGWLDQAIKSVETQSYRNHELIVVQSEAGVSTNFNDGLKRATGDIIRFLCEDDMLTRDSLYHTVTNWQKRFDFVHSNAINFDLKGLTTSQTPILTNPSLADMVQHNHIHGGTVSYHQRCFENGGFDTELWTCEEYDFNMRLLSEGKKLGYIDNFSYLYRRHEKQKSIGNTSSEYQKRRSVVRASVQNKYKE